MIFLCARCNSWRLRGRGEGRIIHSKGVERADARALLLEALARNEVTIGGNRSKQIRPSLNTKEILACTKQGYDCTSKKNCLFSTQFMLFAILLTVLLLTVGLLFVGVIGITFRKVGFNIVATALILVGTFLGSYINIPLLKLKTTVPIIREDYVNFLGIPYRIPQVEYGEAVTVLAVNVGGALIPTAVSIYLLYKAAAQVIMYSLIGVVIVALVTHAVARPVKGVGIVTPALISPIAATLVALVLSPGSPEIVAYVSGVLGTLIGADLTNLKAIPKLGAPMASIGGAGTFDGVFLSGIIAVLLAAL